MIYNRLMPTCVNVAIVGATGAVGQEFLAVLDERQFPIGDLKLLASARSAGRTIRFRGQDHPVHVLDKDSFASMDLALFSAGGSISHEFAPLACDQGCTVVDNSSAFRMTDGVPLIVPEINSEAMAQVKLGAGGIVANPNCSTIIMLLAVTPLYRAAGARRIIVSTYQAASGAGAAAMAELELQTRQSLDGLPLTCEVFDQQYAFNLFSHNSAIGPDGSNTEETKMVRETHKIWNDTQVAITATCVRVPVLRAHAESIYLQCTRALGEAEARDILAKAPGVSLIDDRKANRFPTPLEATGRDTVYVGRIRNVPSDRADNPDALALFVCGDQLRKGAALNAVQIAELLL